MNASDRRKDKVIVALFWGPGFHMALELLVKSITATTSDCHSDCACFLRYSLTQVTRNIGGAKPTCKAIPERISCRCRCTIVRPPPRPEPLPTQCSRISFCASKLAMGPPGFKRFLLCVPIGGFGLAFDRKGGEHRNVSASYKCV